MEKFRFKEKLRIYGYIGTQISLNSIITLPYAAGLNELPYNVEICDLNEDYHNLPFKFTCELLVHSNLCLGYGFELDNRIISYCTDTGLCDNLYKIPKDADLLISECSYKSKQVESEWPHLCPEDAAKIAKQSNEKLLVLTHFDANIY